MFGRLEKIKIDTKYYRLVVETQRDPVILKAELMDLITEIETELSKTPPEPDVKADATHPCGDCAYPPKQRRCGRLWPSERTA